MKKLAILIPCILVLTLFTGCNDSKDLGYTDKVVSSVTISDDTESNTSTVSSTVSNSDDKTSTTTPSNDTDTEPEKDDGIDWGSMDDYLNSDEYTEGLDKYDGLKEEDLYLTTVINTEEELLQVANRVKNGYSFDSENIVINKNLDFKNFEWMPIGTSRTPFMGRILGNGHTISNIKISHLDKAFMDSSHVAYIGFIGNASDAYIADLTIKNINISINDTIKTANVYAGAIAGYFRAYQKTATIVNCKTSGTISVPSKDDGTVNVGGIVGNFDATLPKTTFKLQWLQSNVNITTRGFISNVGGIAGTISLREVTSGSVIQDMIYIGNVNDMTNKFSRAGGIFGNFKSSKPVSISNCFTIIDFDRVEDNKLSLAPAIEGIFIGKEADDCAKITLSNIYGSVKNNGTVVKRNFIGETHGEFVMSNCAARTSLPSGVKFDKTKWNLSNLSAPSFK